MVQLATMLILYTGANTPFNGFPFLANFVASDGYLPRWLTKRGHRLAFSNGIMVLAATSITLILATGGHVNNLIAFYAIGVFTGFTLAGFGMAKYFRTHRGRPLAVQGRHQHDVGCDLGAGRGDLRGHQVHRGRLGRAGALPDPGRRAAPAARGPTSARPTRSPPCRRRRCGRHRSHSSVLLLVDTVDLAVLRAIRYARTLRPAELRAVHFVIDSAHAASLRAAWDAQPGLDIELELIDCPDRRLPGRRSSSRCARRPGPGDEVTVLLPRRTYSAVVGRLLHDRTADDIARAVGQLPGAAATILPFDVVRPLPVARPSSNGQAPQYLSRLGAPMSGARCRSTRGAPTPTGVVPISQVAYRNRAVVQGRVRSVRISPISGQPGPDGRAVRRDRRRDARLLRPALDRRARARRADAGRGHARRAQRPPGDGQPDLRAAPGGRSGRHGNGHGSGSVGRLDGGALAATPRAASMPGPG